MNEGRLIGLKYFGLECTPLPSLGIKVSLAFLQAWDQSPSAKVGTRILWRLDPISSKPLCKSTGTSPSMPGLLKREEKLSPRAHHLPNTLHCDNIPGHTPVLPGNNPQGRPDTIPPRHRNCSWEVGVDQRFQGFFFRNSSTTLRIKERACLSYLFDLQLVPCAALTYPECR